MDERQFLKIIGRKPNNQSTEQDPSLAEKENGFKPNNQPIEQTTSMNDRENGFRSSFQSIDQIPCLSDKENGFKPTNQSIEQISFIKSNYQLNDQIPSLMDYIKILRKWKWLIVICTIAIVIPGTIWLFSVTPIYEAEAAIIYEEADDAASLVDFGQSFYNKGAILNIIEQIKSRTLANDVVNSLPEEIVKTFRMPKRPPENFSRDRFVVRMIIENLKVMNVRGADIIKISIQASDPNAVKIIANSYVDHIVTWNLQKEKKEASNIRKFLDGQLSIFQDKLRTAEEELVDFKEKNVITLSDTSSNWLSSLTEAEIAYNQVKTEREALEQRRRFIEQKKQELMPSLVVSNSEISQQVKRDLLNLERQYSSLQLHAGSEDQETLASIRAKIKQSKRDLINELMKNAVRENLADPLSQIRNLLQEAITLEVDLETYKAREQGLKKILDEYNKKLQKLPKQELELARLIRAKEVNDKIYAILLEKREEARITEAGKVGDIRVIDFAEAPINPVYPKKKKVFVFAVVLGLSFGIILAFLINSLDHSLTTEQDVEKYLGLPAIAAIPKISGNGMLHKITKKEDIDDLYFSKMLSQISTESYIFEAYRSLQLNISFLNPGKNLKSILITSSVPLEGKTITSLNIAQFYAREGTKTLVIDCDLRRPMIHQALKIKQKPGLTNVLIDKAIDFDMPVQILDDKIFNKNLAVLTCGNIPPNPSELLGSKRMEEILARAQDIYELIIIDAPPIIGVTDSIILGKKVDGVFLVLRSGKTNREAALKAKTIVENSKINLAGTILNDIDLKCAYEYYKSFFYYSGGRNKRNVIRS